MKLILSFIVSTSSLWGAFDVQTSWLRASSASATGTPLAPDEISQVTTGDPATVYSESYSKVVRSEDTGITNIAIIDYDLNTNSSGQGLLNSYSFDTELEVISLVSNANASTNFNFSSSIEFTTNTSFGLEALMLNQYGEINDFSLWVDDTLLWSNLAGYQSTPDIGGNMSGFAQYGLGSDFEITTYIIGGGSATNSLTVLGLEVLFGDSEPTHKFEVRTEWEAAEGNVSLFDYAFDVAPDLEFSVVPEVSQFWLPAAIFICIAGTRRRTAQVQ